MERTWGQKHLAVFPEDEAQKWVLRVGDLVIIVNRDESALVVTPRGCCLLYDFEFNLANVV